MHIKRQLTRLSPLSVGIVLLFAAAMTYLLFQAFAASGVATLYTSPSGSRAVTKGQSFTVSVRISTPSNASVTGASVYLTYPSSLLQVTSESYSGSAYNTQLLASNSGGVLRMDRAAFPAISGGDKLFAQVSFKAVATGSASISFNSSSIVTSGEDDSNILGQRNGVSYKISSASTSSSTSSSTTKSNTSSSSGKQPATSNSSNSSNNESSTSSTDSPSSSTTNDSVKPDTNSPQSQINEENPIISYGFMVKVVDEQNNPVVNAEVTIGGQTVKTDKNGLAEFQDLSAGNHGITISYKGNKTFATGQVKSASTSGEDQAQPFTVKINKNRSNPLIFILPPLLALALAAIFLFLRPKLMASRAPVTANGIKPAPSEPTESTESILARLKSPDTPEPGSAFKPNGGTTEAEAKSDDKNAK